MQVKRNKAKLPALKDMITPFLTEAIQEEMCELKRLENELEAGINDFEEELESGLADIDPDM